MNLYGEQVPLMIDSGRFGRCRHHHTHWNPCWRCGMFHPLSFLKHWFYKKAK